MKIEINQYLVPLSQGKFAIVDAEGWEKVKNYKWCYGGGPRNGYALKAIWDKRSKKRSTTTMHRFLFEDTLGKDIDHINGDKLDNRYSNLRLCEKHENLKNRGKNKNNTSGFKGVTWNKIAKKWMAQIMVEGKYKYLGVFADKEEAARAYNEAAVKLHNQFANINKL